MADKELKNKISIATYGIGTDIDDDSKLTGDLVKQTSLEVANKFGKLVDNKIIDTYTGLNLTNLFSVDNKTKTVAPKQINSVSDFKAMMEENSGSAIQMIGADQGRVINYSNYEAILQNIPEMAMALDTYVSNILSPDDYNKRIFNIEYKNSETQEHDAVLKKLHEICDKYKLEDLTEEIVSKTLTFGDCFLAVLPYDTEISKFIANTSASGLLNEDFSIRDGFQYLDETFHLTERTNFTTLNEDAVNDCLSFEEKELLTEAFGTNADTIVTNMVNKNIQIRSVTDLLRSKALADNDVLFRKADVEVKQGKKGKKSSNDGAIKINGSSIRILDASKIVPLNIDGVCYGYYYIEPGFMNNQEQPYNAMNAAGYAQTSNPMNPTIQPQPEGKDSDTASNPVAKNLSISDEKMSLISGVLLKAISKKLNKEYIAENKQFKDLLYNLLRQKYLFEKGISITYFLPEEIVHFESNSIYEKIVFFAKLYIAILTNTVIIKLGRGNDRTIYYIDTGLDNNSEQDVMNALKDMKTREFKMSNLGNIVSILSLNPGRFYDMFMPTMNGERPIDIETLQGMDQDINNDFIAFLRRSMVQGTGLPSALLEAEDNIEFARQISTQNTEFCKRVVRYQKDFTEPFSHLLRVLYTNEYKYTLDGQSNIETKIDLNDIIVIFPSPAALKLTNMVETFTQADTASEYIMKRFVPDKVDQSNIDEQAAFKAEVIADNVPQVDWDKYSEMYKSFKNEYYKKMEAEVATKPKQEPVDPYGGGY